MWGFRLISPFSKRHFDKADLVIEAVFENLAVKHKVIQEVEKHTPKNCIIATNTSAIPIADVWLTIDCGPYTLLTVNLCSLSSFRDRLP